MTIPPNSPDRWVRGVVTLFPTAGSPGEFEGTMSIDGVVIYVERWRKVSGHVEFRAQYQADAEFDRLAEELAGRSEA